MAMYRCFAESESHVKIAYPSPSTTMVEVIDDMISPYCIILDESGVELGRIKRGGSVIIIPCSSTKNIIIKRRGNLSEQSYKISPGENYEIRMSHLNKLSLVRVDYIVQ